MSLWRTHTPEYPGVTWRFSVQPEEKDPIPVACSPLNGSIFFFFITLKPLHISVKNWELALSSGERPLNRGGRTYARENTLHPTLYTVYRKQLGLNRKP